jgi:biotin transport system substrate-specific component
VSAAVRQTIRGPISDRLVSRGLFQLDKMNETIEAFALAGATAQGVAAARRNIPGLGLWPKLRPANWMLIAALVLYLTAWVAFPAAAFITGAFAEHGWDRKFLTAAAAMAIGSLVIMISGWLWFSFVMRTSPAITLFATVLKFIPGDIIKISLAAAVLPSGWKLLKR